MRKSPRDRPPTTTPRQAPSRSTATAITGRAKRPRSAIGTIERDFTFSFSDVYALTEGNKRLLQAIVDLLLILMANGIDIGELGATLNDIIKNLTSKCTLENTPLDALKWILDSIGIPATSTKIEEIKQDIAAGADISGK